MTLDQLRIFVAVAEREHVTRAAEALHLTQSATSAAIAALEQRHAVKLFHRIGRRIILTQEGTQFLYEARAVLARVAAAELMLNDLAGLKQGTVSIQASQTIASYWLPRFLVRFRQRYPGVKVDLTIGNTSQVSKAVASGEAELGFVEGAVQQPILVAEEIGADHLAIVGVPTKMGQLAEACCPTSLTQLEWVLREKGSGTRSEFESMLARIGIDPASLNIVLELPSNEAVRAAVIEGAGASAISELVVSGPVKAGLLVKLALEMPSRPFFLIRHRDRYHSKAVSALSQLVREGA